MFQCHSGLINASNLCQKILKFCNCAYKENIFQHEKFPLLTLFAKMGQVCTALKELKQEGSRCRGRECAHGAATPALGRLNLSEYETVLIHESWERSKINGVGQRMLVSLLVKRPRLAAYFGVTPGTYEELLAAPEVRIHGYRIVGFFDSIICGIGFLPEAKVREMIQRVGYIHFHKGVNFNADNWLLFKQVLLEELCRVEPPSSPAATSNVASPVLALASSSAQCRPNELTAAWNKLLRLIISEMKRGFLEEAVRNCECEGGEF